MKKLTLILVVLLTIGLVGAFAETEVTGKIQHQVDSDFETLEGSWGDNELYFDADVDDYNSVNLTLLVDGDVTNPVMHDYYVTTDVTGALGVDAPLSLDTTIGRFDNWITQWSYVTNRGHEYMWPGKFDHADGGAIKAAFGFDPVNVYWLNNFSADDFQVGMDGSFADASFALSYSADGAAPSEGTIGFDANYDLAIDDMTSVYVPVAAKYYLADQVPDEDYEDYQWSTGVKGSYDMATLGVGVSGDDADALGTVAADLNLAATDEATVFGVGVFDLAAETNTIEFGGSYDLGALTLQAGYVVDADEAGHSTYNFGSVTGNSFYLNSSIEW